MKYIDLDTCVENALELFTTCKIPKLHHSFKRPLIIGSGNAAVTGKIIFEDVDAVFADESNYVKKLKTAKVDGAVLLSASGSKHAPILALALKKKRLKTVLVTNNILSLAGPIVNKVFVYPKNTEPYTYNTSTYLGMILGKTREDPQKILRFIKRSIKPKIPSFRRYDAFFFIVPNEFDNVREMFLTKFDELFGTLISRRVFTVDQVKHAKTLVPDDRCCFIGLGVNNRTWGKHRVNFPLPKNAGSGAVTAIGYWIIGQIQKQNPPYFKRFVARYTTQVSKLFKQKIKSIVE